MGIREPGDWPGHKKLTGNPMKFNGGHRFGIFTSPELLFVFEVICLWIVHCTMGGHHLFVRKNHHLGVNMFGALFPSIMAKQIYA